MWAHYKQQFLGNRKDFSYGNNLHKIAFVNKSRISYKDFVLCYRCILTSIWSSFFFLLRQSWHFFSFHLFSKYSFVQVKKVVQMHGFVDWWHQNTLGVLYGWMTILRCPTTFQYFFRKLLYKSITSLYLIYCWWTLTMKHF